MALQGTLRWRFEYLANLTHNNLIAAIVCGKPPPVPHATYRGTKFTYKGKVRYTCNKGYKMEERSWRKCKFNGKWTKKPKCISK